jgi:hypothetical protein
MTKYFGEEAYSVAMHPSGLYVLVGFIDKLRLMNILMDDLRPVREFSIKSCREVPPSNSVSILEWRTCICCCTWKYCANLFDLDVR